MGSISDYLENQLLDHVFENTAYTPPATVYLGYSTADPLDDASGLAEPSSGGYSRKAITFAAAASRSITQSGDVTFDQATGSQGTITHYAIFDAASGGNMLAHGALSTAQTIVAGNTPVVASGEVVISFTSSVGLSDYLANTLLDFAFRNQSFTAPQTYLGLATADLSDATTGSTVTEPGGNGYSRLDFGDWSAASGGAVTNNTTATFSSPTGSWGEITAAFIADAATGGNILWYENDITPQTPESGDTVRFNAGDFDVSLS